MRSVFLLRAYEAGGAGYQRIESEFIFTALSSAMGRVDSLRKQKLFSRFEILEYQVDSGQDNTVANHWHFSHTGKAVTIPSLIHSNNAGEADPDAEDFTVGSYVIPQILSRWDYSLREILPISVITGISRGNDPLYVLENINDLGYLERDHYSLCELRTRFQVYPYSLPDKYKFLGELSRHYRKLSPLDEKLLKRVYNGEIFLFNIETYY